MVMNEHRVNLGHKSNINGFRKMFQGGETEVRADTAHNCHENVARIQEGGLALLSYGTLIDYYDAPEKIGQVWEDGW